MKKYEALVFPSLFGSPRMFRFLFLAKLYCYWSVIISGHWEARIIRMSDRAHIIVV